MMITSTVKMNDAFREKEDKYSVWATRETREKKVAKAVMVALIISHDGAYIMTLLEDEKSLHPTSRSTWS